MRDESGIAVARAIPRHGVLILTGYGIRIAVERGHLVVADGRGIDRRAGRFSRASRELKRLVVIGHTGTITLEALRWLHDVGCAFVQIDKDGELIAAAGPQGLDDPRLRRAQAMAPWNGTGIALARDLLHRKLNGQALVLDQKLACPEGARRIHDLSERLCDAETPDRLRQVEADAAIAYWAAWTPLPIRWANADQARVPDHWRSFGVRRSPLTRSPRLAANPVNALLNYAYAVLEAEARIAAMAVGLDPGLGVLHADLNARDSLALDLMEAVRPEIDDWVLEVLTTRTFRKTDFFETREGACRLMPSLAKRLAEQAPQWASALAPVAEAAALSFTSSEKSPQRLPTPLTEANRRTGRPAGHRRRQPRTAPSLAATCQTCGAELDQSERRYCQVCLPDRRAEVGAQWVESKRATLQQLRHDGHDPAHGGEAARKRAERLGQHRLATKTWEEAENRSLSSLDFSRDILPRLQSISLGRIAEATGLSPGYCSFVRRGLRIPHRRHWRALAALADQQSRALTQPAV